MTEFGANRNDKENDAERYRNHVNIQLTVLIATTMSTMLLNLNGATPPFSPFATFLAVFLMCC